MFNRRFKTDNPDVISAIWILACNDQNPIITYNGLVQRLGLQKAFDVRALIASRRELFRPGVPLSLLNAWKEAMLQGTSVPSWISSLPTVDERKQAINSLTVQDAFRSQFRAEDNSARSPIEIISWGLEHLDRLRKAKAEALDASAKRWQMWLVFWVSVAGIISQFAIAWAKNWL